MAIVGSRGNNQLNTEMCQIFSFPFQMYPSRLHLAGVHERLIFKHGINGFLFPWFLVKFKQRKAPLEIQVGAFILLATFLPNWVANWSVPLRKAKLLSGSPLLSVFHNYVHSLLFRPNMIIFPTFTNSEVLHHPLLNSLMPVHTSVECLHYTLLHLLHLNIPPASC